MKIILFIFFTSFHYIFCVVLECKAPIPGIKRTTLHKNTINFKSKRSGQNLRIYRHYDNTFNERLNSDKLKFDIVEPAFQFWEEALIVKNPLSFPLLLDRECTTTYRYEYNSLGKIKICTDDCVPYETCHKTIIPSQYFEKCYTSNTDGTYNEYGERGRGVEKTDLLIIVSSVSHLCEKNTAAYAMPCHLDHDFDRPVVGFINICPGQLKVGKDLQKSIKIVQHEIVHILGFSAGLYAFFRDKFGNPLTPRDSYGNPSYGFKYIGDEFFYQWSEKTVIEEKSQYSYRNGKEEKLVSYLVTENVLRELRSHFNCSTLSGVPLEDYGSVGNILSHLEKRVFQNELMTPSMTNPISVSRITMAVLQDTGWYEPDYNKADQFAFAKGAGCDFVTKSCFEYIKNQKAQKKSVYPYCDDLSSVKQLKCSSNLKSIVYCGIIKQMKSEVPLKHRYFDDWMQVSFDEFSEYCPYDMHYETNESGKLTSGICGDISNNAFKNTKYDNLIENYGPSSTCIMTDRSHDWALSHCGRTILPNETGAGCYRYRCSSDYRLLIDVNGMEYQCLSDGQIIYVYGSTKYYLFSGKLICPQCSILCDKSICSSYTQFLPLKCDNINKQCPNETFIDITCSNAIFRIKVLYLCTLILSFIYFKFL